MARLSYFQESRYKWLMEIQTISRHPIQALPPSLVDQIAAGEVVERPASALKEILENSLDSGAKTVEVILQGGGKDLLEVRDDGCGIPEIEMPLALQRHATSKIRTLEDLNQVRSMGFRGEALAAIASISQIRLTSRTAESEHGYELEQEGGRLLSEGRIARPQGTTISVRNLFFNTPAREKFIKSAGAETNACVQVFLRIALANPAVHFALTVDGKIKARFPECEKEKERIAQAFAFLLREPIQSEDLVEFSRVKEDIAVYGFVLPMEYCTHNSRGIFTFVNGRVVKDKVLTQAVMAGAKEVLFGHQYPQVALFLEVNPNRVDVNVHPTKAEVRFAEPSPFGLIRVAVREALARVHNMGEAISQAHTSQSPAPNSHDENHTAEPATAGTLPPQSNANLPIELGRNFRQKQSIPQSYSPPILRSDFANDSPPVEPSTPQGSDRRIMGLIHNTYIVCEESNGLLLVDQHAAHERITYEKLRKTKFHPPLRSQKLLIPIVVEVASHAIDLLEPLFDQLAEFGLELDRFGPEQIKVESLPTLLLRKNGSPRVSVPKLIQDFSMSLQSEVSDEMISEKLQEVLLDTLASEACHGSVRAGQALSQVEMEALLADMSETDFAAHCPHGRPTTVRLSWNEIEKLFKRKV